VNAVFILWLQQLKRYFHSRARMIGSLGQPTLFPLGARFRRGERQLLAHHAGSTHHREPQRVHPKTVRN
jgi:ABC-2 type transport system permease protein